MSGKQSLLAKNPDDVVILAAKRTPMCKASKGGLKDARVEDMEAAVLRAVLAASKVDPKLVEDVQFGTVRTPRGGASITRMACLAAGLPVETSVSTVNRQCSSSLQAIWTITNEIREGDIDIGIAGGVESMTHHYARTPLDHPTSDEVMQTKRECVTGDELMEVAADCLIPMGITNENVVEDYGLTRAQLDEFAANSFRKAEAAQKGGRFDGEIAPVTVKGTAVSRDDTIRYGVTPESLSGIKPAFKKDGSTHAGNSSQLTDGAAAVVLARRSVANKLGLPIIGKVGKVVSTGVPPRIMGVGPAYAIPKALERTGLKLSDVDIFEINEAFAGQALYCAQKLGLDQAKLNPNGGAIALGHPLGATGARQVATGLNEAKRSGAKIIVTSMCAGTGFGVAGVFVNEQPDSKL